MRKNTSDLVDTIERLDGERAKLFKVLGPQLIHAPTTHQLESALKELDAAIGLLRGVVAQWESDA